MQQDAPSPPRRRRGRPIGFDRDRALRQAMLLFWERGYDGTSFDDLVGAMGISPSSFYVAFGSKERLYREAAEAYAVEVAAWFESGLEAATDARTAVHDVLSTAAGKFTQGDDPAGCMIALAYTNVPPAQTGLREHMAGQRRRSEAALATRIRRGVLEGDTPPDTDADALAAFYSALSRGLVVQARDGAPRERLQQIVEIGMRAWPGTRRASRAT